MNKGNVIILFMILLIIFFISFFSLSGQKLYFDLKGNSYLELNIGEEYDEIGFEALSCNKYLKLFCKNISNKVDINKKSKNDKLFINYEIKYNNNKKVLTREIVFKDLESPKITLEGNDINLCPNQTYVESGFKAYDNVDGDITNNVEVKTINNKIYYNVIDSSGNKKTIFRKVNYNDTVAPTIKLNGNKTIYVYKGQKYNEYGINVSDNCDSNLESNVKIINNVDTNKIGKYKVIYTVDDNSGNITSVTRNVIVYDDISDVEKNGKVVYLTFDDGPVSYTIHILDILKKYNVKATFFVTNQFSNYQYLIKREYIEGHSVAVHTYSHNYKQIYSSLDNYILDFDNMNQIIFEQTGNYSKLFRFPGGSSNTISRFNRGIMSELDKKMTELGYIYFDWNVDSMDTSYKDPDKIAESVIKGMEENEYSIVLMHDIKKANIESVDKIISYGLENGYTFLPLDENSPIHHHKINN